MARPLKERLDYFALDVDYFSDPKFVRLRTVCGVEGEVIAIRLLCAVYRHSYYAAWTDNLLFALADQLNMKPEAVDKAVDYMVECGLFHRESFETHGVLTSEGIQKRWKMANVRRRKPPVLYWLPGDGEEGESGVCAEQTGVCESQTEVFDAQTGDFEGDNPRKEKEREEEERRAEERKERDEHQGRQEGWEARSDLAARLLETAKDRFYEKYCMGGADGDERGKRRYAGFEELCGRYPPKMMYDAVMRALTYSPKYPLQYVKAVCEREAENARPE